MSRYELQPKQPHHEVSIGWDPPLGNFFLQVYDTDINDEVEDPVVVWLGADGYATETDVDQVLEEAAIWAEIIPELRSKLLQDHLREGMRPPMWTNLAPSLFET
jgi:hypothetical protein